MTTTFTQPDLDHSTAVDLLRGAGFEVDEPVTIRRVVIDTFDGRLHRAGLRLEALSGEDRVLVLSAQGGSPPATIPWTRVTPATVDVLPRGPFASRVTSVVGDRVLLPVMDLTTSERRAQRRDRRDKQVVTAVLHEVVEVEGLDRTGGTAGDVPPWMLSIEPVVGHGDDAARTLTRLGAKGLVAHEGDAVEVLAEALGRSLTGRVSSPTVPLDAHEDALVAVRAVLANLTHTMLDNLPGTLADLDPEFLHELRVAIRRTRSVLAESKGVVPGDIRARYRLAFKDLGTTTGRTRDLDVYVLGWDELVAPLHLGDASMTAPVLAALERHRRRAHKAMAKVLDSAETRTMLAEWQGWLADPGDVDPVGPIGPIVAERTAAAQQVLLDAGRTITRESPAEDLHDLRKDAKVLRYLLECFGSLYPASLRKAFVSQLKDLQDNLGEHQDAEVQLNELRDVAHDLHAAAAVDTDALLTVGRMIDHLERRRVAARAEFLDRFSAYDTKQNRQLLSELLATVADT